MCVGVLFFHTHLTQLHHLADYQYFGYEQGVSFPVRLSRKYCMRPLQNIVDLLLFSSLVSEEKCSLSSLPWWDDCIHYVELQVLTDRTTSHDNLREKAKNYASNYIAMQTEVSFLQKDWFLEDIADKVEIALKNVAFDQRPPASVIAQKARTSIPDDPEKRFIKLR